MQVYSLTSGYSNSDQDVYTTSSISPTSNRLVLAFVFSGAADPVAAPTLSGAGMTWVAVNTQWDPSESYRLTVYRAMKASPGSGAVTITHSVTMSRCAWSIFEVSDVNTGGTDGASAVVASYNNAGNGTSLSVTLNAPASADNRAFAGFLQTSDQDINHRTNWTEIHDIRNVGESGGVETQWRSDTFETTASASWASSAGCVGIAVEVAAKVTHLLGGTVQGVAGLSGPLSLTHRPGGIVQGVGAASGPLNLTIPLGGTFQGVGRLSGRTEGVPFLDFKKYDGYIEDDVGLLGVIYYEGDERKETLSRQLEAPRQDTGLNPNELRPESGAFFAQGDFTHGAGQRYFHHQDADPKKYLRSEGFDISEQGKLTHLHDVASSLADVNVGVATQANGLLLVASGSDVKVKDGNWPGSYSSEDPEVAEGAVTVEDLCSSGDEAFAALGVRGIHKRNAAGTWSHWNDVQATRVAWVKGRIVAADGRSIYEVLSSGAAPSAIEQLPEGWTFEQIFEAGEFIYALAINTDAAKSEYHIYGLKTDLTGLEKKGSEGFPDGQLIKAGSGYLNQILLGGGIKNESGGYDPVLYRAAVIADTTGFLQYAKIAQEVGSGSSDLSVRAFAPFGESIVFGWSTTVNCTMGLARAGLGIYSFATDAFSWHLKATTTAAAVRSVLLFSGRLVMTVSGAGAYYEDTTNVVSTATLISSVADWNSAGGKLWDLLSLSHNALPSGASVKMEYTTELPDASTTWVEAFRSNVTDSDGSSIRMSSLRSRLLAVRLTSTKSGSGSPEIVAYSIRGNLSPDFPEFRLVRFVRLQDRDKKNGFAEEIHQDSSAIRVRLLRLSNTWVTLYEPDINWLARVEAVGDSEPVLSNFDPLGRSNKDLFVVRLLLSGTIS